VLDGSAIVAAWATVGGSGVAAIELDGLTSLLASRSSSSGSARTRRMRVRALDLESIFVRLDAPRSPPANGARH
jgi:hypothetical protein